MDNRQWREFMDAVMGEPPGRVTVAAVRRRVVRRRAAGIAATVALIAVIAAVIPALAATSGRSGPAGRGSHATVYVAYDISSPPCRVGRPCPAHGAGAGGVVVPVNTALHKAGRPIGDGEGAISFPGGQIAITPDGKTAYVANGTRPTTITPISTASNRAGPPIRVGGPLSQIAITPDGKTAYVLGLSTGGHAKGRVIPVSTATHEAGKPIYLPWLHCCGFSAISIAITPDGKTVYVTTDSPRTVVPISTATNTAGKPIALGASNPPTAARSRSPRTGRPPMSSRTLIRSSRSARPPIRPAARSGSDPAAVAN